MVLERYRQQNLKSYAIHTLPRLNVIFADVILLFLMQKRFTPFVLLVFYFLILIKIMVFKDIPTIRIGQMMLNFSGTNANGQANFIPFKTILPYLLGYKGLIIAGVNLLGNILPLVPVGLLGFLVFKQPTWKKSLILAVASGLILELLQVVLHVGIFDIDDLILNAFGVLLGYGIFSTVVKFILPSFWLNL